MTSAAAKEMRLQVTTVLPEAAEILSLGLAHPEGAPLPPIEPGAHIALRLGDGLVRQYSLCNGPGEACEYRIAVKRETASRGGSAAVHRLRVGDIVPVTPPVNRFPVDQSARHLILLAGGIGITPLVCMAKDALRRGQSFELHYFARSQDHAAFYDLLSVGALAAHASFHFGIAADAVGAHMERLLKGVPAGSQLYVCGPGAFIDTARSLGAGHPQVSAVHWESFATDQGAAAPGATSAAFTVRLARSGRTLQVAPDKSILQVLQESGVVVDSSCMEGICGLCISPVLEGEPEHRDEVLSDEEKARGDQMTICVSRCRGDLLVLDI